MNWAAIADVIYYNTMMKQAKSEAQRKLYSVLADEAARKVK